MEIQGRYLEDSKLYHHTFKSMGTRMDVILCGKEAATAESIFLDIQRTALQIEGMLSGYRADSEINRINRLGAKQKLHPDPELMFILKDCAHYHETSLGYFDPTIGKIKEFWQRNSPDANSQKEMNAILKASGWENVLLNQEEGSIQFLSEHIQLDLGGYGKGYALQKIWELLAQAGVPDALISFGESSVLALGHHPHGNHWRLGIQHAFEPSKLVHTQDLSNQAMSTSGLTPNNLRANKNGRGHLVNPHNAEVLTGIRSLSVVSRSPLEAEVLSTALILASEKDRETILSRYPEIRVVAVEYNDQNIPSVLSFT